jgi:hypothetical protein
MITAEQLAEFRHAVRVQALSAAPPSVREYVKELETEIVHLRRTDEAMRERAEEYQMSGICSAHMGHDSNCSQCASSSPEEAKQSQEYAEAFGRGVERGIEAVAEWLEGAQWTGDGKPCLSDAWKIIDEGAARMLARAVRGRFVHKPQPSTFPVLWQGDRAYLKALADLDCPRKVPWAFVADHEMICQQNHGQTAYRLAERGGLSPEEMLAIIEHHSLRTARDQTWWLLPSESVPRLKAALEKWRKEHE